MATVSLPFLYVARSVIVKIVRIEDSEDSSSSDGVIVTKGHSYCDDSSYLTVVVVSDAACATSPNSNTSNYGTVSGS